MKTTICRLILRVRRAAAADDSVKAAIAALPEAIRREADDVDARNGRLAHPITLPDGSRCWTENCRRHKGMTREAAPRGEPKRVYKVDQSQSRHKQIADLADAITRASADGERLEAVIERPEFGKLTLDCGAPGVKGEQDKGGHGVQHALENRHHVSALDLARALLTGEVTQHEFVKSRRNVFDGVTHVIIELEKKKGSGRISRTDARIVTAMRRSAGTKK